MLTGRQECPEIYGTAQERSRKHKRGDQTRLAALSCKATQLGSSIPVCDPLQPQSSSSRRQHSLRSDHSSFRPSAYLGDQAE